MTLYPVFKDFHWHRYGVALSRSASLKDLPSNFFTEGNGPGGSAAEMAK
jgi:hypothetical protein